MCFNSQSSRKPSLSPEFLQAEGHRPAVASVGSWQWFPLARGHQCFQLAKLQRDTRCTRSGRRMTRVCSGCIKISSLNYNETGSVLSPWFSFWSGQEPACMERRGKQVLYTKHPCSAALWAVALCSARRVQSALSIARVELASGRHSSAHHFYPGENWKMLPSPALLNGQLKAWEYILTLLKPVAGLPWISAMPVLHLPRARRERALNCNTTEKSLCLLLKKS